MLDPTSWRFGSGSARLPWPATGKPDVSVPVSLTTATHVEGVAPKSISITWRRCPTTAATWPPKVYTDPCRSTGHPGSSRPSAPSANPQPVSLPVQTTRIDPSEATFGISQPDTPASRTGHPTRTAPVRSRETTRVSLPAARAMYTTPSGPGTRSTVASADALSGTASAAAGPTLGTAAGAVGLGDGSNDGVERAADGLAGGDALALAVMLGLGLGLAVGVEFVLALEQPATNRTARRMEPLRRIVVSPWRTPPVRRAVDSRVTSLRDSSGERSPAACDHHGQGRRCPSAGRTARPRPIIPPWRRSP